MCLSLLQSVWKGWTTIFYTDKRCSEKMKVLMIINKRRKLFCVCLLVSLPTLVWLDLVRLFVSGIYYGFIYFVVLFDSVLK